jgi:type I restriction enzyme S subunit
VKGLDEWVGELPATWEAKPLRAVADYTVSNVDKVPEEHEAPVRLCNYTDVYNNEFITLDLNFMSSTATDEEINKFGLQIDDVVITKDSESWDDIGIPALVKESAQDLVCGYHLAVLRAHKDTLDGAFLFRCLQAKPIRVQLELAANGVTRFGIPKSNIGSMKIPVPPFINQRIIADYLDRETARLDSLVAAKERVLGLLAEKRRALITRAVTRGLTPHVPLRDSGIPWLGEIPTHWAATRMKFLATEPLAYGANEAALEDDPSFPRFVRITDVDSESNLRNETFKSLPPEVAEPYLLRDGDVLLARSGATVGKAFIYKPSWGVACFAGYLIRCRCNTLLMQPDFLFAYTQTEPYWGQVREGTIQATIQNFSAEKYGDLVVTVPPLKEQKAIISYITAETAKLDGLRSANERTIALLKERRAALIAAAVTGAIKVKVAA